MHFVNGFLGPSCGALSLLSNTESRAAKVQSRSASHITSDGLSDSFPSNKLVLRGIVWCRACQSHVLNAECPLVPSARIVL